jgi:hypothetical protein
VGSEGLKNNGMGGGGHGGFPGGAGFAGFGDPFKLFEQMFGGGGGPGGGLGSEFHFNGGGFPGFGGGGGMPGGFGGGGMPGGFGGMPGGGQRRRPPQQEAPPDLYSPSSKVLRLTESKFPDARAKVRSREGAVGRGCAEEAWGACVGGMM